ncbi:MAG: hypothetical protein F2873_04690 [Actinobacteria bacterium]|uniref:Unannotated protein n=1 Tax=freshwater metagenome TaxID=449393 RepID=A0A6J7NAT8_9ZZZZ|nr:hypothetical protein [Actinomycetota bacterium]
MRPARAARRFVPVLVAVLGLSMAVGAAAASAHASLDDASPRAGAVLEGPPLEVVLDFDSEVEQQLTGLRLLDATGADVLLNAPLDTPDRTQVVVPLRNPEDVPAGVYVVRYRVTSVDSHVMHGAFTFQVGAAVRDQRAVLESVGAGGASPALEWVIGALRLVALAGFSLFVGTGVLAAVAAGASGGMSVRQRLHLTRTGWAAVAIAAVSTVLLLAAQAAHSAGFGLGGIADVSAWSDAAPARFGIALLVRLVLVAFCGLVVGGVGLAGGAAWRATFVALVVCLAVTFGLSGHPGTGRLPALGLLLNGFHLLAAALWVGGLGVVLLGRRTWLGWGEADADAETDAGAGTDAAAMRLVTLLPYAVAVLVLTGAAQSWRLVRSVSALDGTTFGGVFVGKMAISVLVVVVVIAASAAIRRSTLLPARRLLVAHAVLGVVAMGVSAGLVGLNPDERGPLQPAAVSVQQGTLSVSLVVTPAVEGANDFHLVMDESDAVTPTAEARLSISRPEAGISEVSIPLAPDGPNHYSAYGVSIPQAGTWQVAIEVGRADGTTATLSTSVRIAG